MNILIYGLGSHGVEIEEARYFIMSGHNVFVADIQETSSPSDSALYLREMGCTILSGDSLQNFDFSLADVVIRSQTVGFENAALKNCKSVTSDLGFFLSSPLLRGIKLIGITGDRDKSLTGSCVCSALNSFGVKAHLCGINGSSPFDELNVIAGGDVPEVIVIVVPAFKLNDFIESGFAPVPDFELFAITGGNAETLFCTSAEKKSNIFPSRYFIYPENFIKLVCCISGRKRKGLSSIESMCSYKPKSVQSSMNSAYAVLRRLGYKSGAIKKALDGFKGIPNSNELVVRTDTSIWYNSSFVDVPEAVGICLNNFAGLPVHLIAGGDGEYRNLSFLNDSFKNAVSVHLLPGTFTDSSIIPYLKTNNIRYYGPFHSMTEAVDSCRSKLSCEDKALEVVLLAPGAMCYRSFGSESERGRQFRKCVSDLLNN